MIDVSELSIDDYNVHDIIHYYDTSLKTKLLVRIIDIKIPTNELIVKPFWSTGKWGSRIKRQYTLSCYRFLQEVRLLKIIKNNNQTLEEIEEEFPELFI